MFVDPNELSDEKVDELMDVTMSCFAQSLNFITEIEDNMQLVKYIHHAYENYMLSIMIDVPHPEWWPDHDMYDEAERLDAEEELVANEAGDIESANAETQEASGEKELEHEPKIESPEDLAFIETDNLSLEHFIELSVVATPTEDSPSSNDDEGQVVLASILFPNVYIDHLDELNNSQMLSSIELQWLPERNTLEQ